MSSMLMKYVRNRLLEVMLSVAPMKIYTQIYAKCFINRLAVLAQHREANFAVQKLVNYGQEKAEVLYLLKFIYLLPK